MRVDVRNLVKRHDRHFTLHIPELTIAPGTTLGLVGNNGAGKTTFLRLLLDLLPTDEGRIHLGGVPVATSTDWKLRTGSFLDESFLIDFLTPDEFFAFNGRLYGLDEAAIDAALAPYRSFFPDIASERTARYLRDLSSGNRQRAGLIAAMFIQPDLLVLDEPFASLDPRSQFQLRALLRRLNHEHGTTMIISSHDLSHVTEICDRIALIEDGQIVRSEDTQAHTLANLQHYFSQQMTGSLPRQSELLPPRPKINEDGSAL